MESYVLLEEIVILLMEKIISIIKTVKLLAEFLILKIKYKKIKKKIFLVYILKL